jgi:ADP-heptose:LPS heptosyltransferase
MARKKILLVHLVSNGDCLMATTVARQIKSDFPGCHLTWAISYKCKQAIENNPFVDSIWSVEYAANESPVDAVWYRTKQDAERRKAAGEFDEVYYTQIFPENVGNFDGTTRTTIFRSYPRPISVPVQPTLRLYDHEIERVRGFAARQALDTYRKVVLFECAPGSSQSSLSPEIAIRVATRVLTDHQDAAFIISSHLSFSSPAPNIIDGSSLSFRENAELSKYCTLLLGCSSGITWLLTSTAAKTIPTIQFLGGPAKSWFSFASVKYDHRFFGLDASHVFETAVSGEAEMADLVTRYLNKGTFDGLAESTFVPSIHQIQDLYRMLGLRTPLRRVVRNFAERNKDVAIDKLALYRGVAEIALRQQVNAVLRKIRR